MNKVFPHYLSLPKQIKAFVSPAEDGDFHLFINTEYPLSTQKEILTQELHNIVLGHYSNQHHLLKKFEHQSNSQNQASKPISLLFNKTPLTEAEIDALTSPYKYNQNGEEMDTLERLTALSEHLNKVHQDLNALTQAATNTKK